MSNKLSEITNLYFEIDINYAIQQRAAITKHLIRKEKQYQQKRDNNDQAYFIYIFSRLEDRIKSTCDKIITRKLTSKLSTRHKAPWYIVKERRSDDRLTFMECTSLVFEKGSSNYNKIQPYYSIRNKVVHGGNFPPNIVMNIVVNDLQQIYKNIRA